MCGVGHDALVFVEQKEADVAAARHAAGDSLDEFIALLMFLRVLCICRDRGLDGSLFLTGSSCLGRRPTKHTRNKMVHQMRLGKPSLHHMAVL